MASSSSQLPRPVSSADAPKKPEPPPEDPEMSIAQITTPTPEEVLSVVDSLKKQVVAGRLISLKQKLEENRQKVVGVTEELGKILTERNTSSSIGTLGSQDLLAKRQNDAIDMHNDLHKSNGARESNGDQEESHSSTPVLLGRNIAAKNPVRPSKLPEIRRLPPYTTWVFLNRNQRMTEDESVVGRRQIYYDPDGGETLICSDTEEDIIDEEEEKKDFVESEDYMLRMTIEELGLSDVVLESLGQCFSRNTSEIKARYGTLCSEHNADGGSKNGDTEDNFQGRNLFLEKDLDAALGSFDNLFCRRCLGFVCGVHTCPQDLVFPADKQTPWIPSDTENAPCGPNCFQLVLKSEGFANMTSSAQAVVEENYSGSAGDQLFSRKASSGPSDRRQAKCSQSEGASSNARNMPESCDSENSPGHNIILSSHPTPPKPKSLRKGGIGKKDSRREAERVLVSMQKQQMKTVASDSYSIGEGLGRSTNKMVTTPPFIRSEEDDMRTEEFVGESISQQELNGSESWKPLEKGLLEKGMEIFGKNSCLIARNLLNGLKTCWEVFQYINCNDARMSGPDDDSKGNNKVRRRSRFLRRRTRVRRLRYTWRSTAYHSIRKRIKESKDEPYRQYIPCGCQSACGKECPCRENGTCCEKYCGCPDSCKNRFRGCHCAKSMCQSRQCPCFAADRECDPDVCRNCWVSCGDDSLGIPIQRGDNYECRNMKLLLKQHQRILLGRSDVSGWGAFLKDSVGKHEYLGEYTGELISNLEAEKRGKLYDRVNSSFLFTLNKQFVLDAYRKGNKLKFANHSAHPNCHAKIVMVAGDHRVAIFSKEPIRGGEELFYDYHYAPGSSPTWWRRLEASGSKKEDGAPSSGRAKKRA